MQGGEERGRGRVRGSDDVRRRGRCPACEGMREREEEREVRIAWGRGGRGVSPPRPPPEGRGSCKKAQKARESSYGEVTQRPRRGRRIVHTHSRVLRGTMRFDAVRVLPRDRCTLGLSEGVRTGPLPGISLFTVLHQTPSQGQISCCTECSFGRRICSQCSSYSKSARVPELQWCTTVTKVK